MSVKLSLLCCPVFFPPVSCLPDFSIIPKSVTSLHLLGGTRAEGTFPTLSRSQHPASDGFLSLF